MQSRFINAKVLRMTDTPVVEEHLQVWVENDRISFVGTDKEAEEMAKISKTETVRTIDCEGNLLMPGFKNAHTHSAMTFLRSKADDMALHDWLNLQVFPAEAKLTPEDVEIFTKLAILEYLQSGITGIFEMYLIPDAIAKACIELGMRVTMTGSLNDFCQSVEQMREWTERYNHVSSLVRFLPGFHAEYTTSYELLQKVAALALELKLPVFAHMCETESECQGCLQRYGKTPVALFDSLGMFEYGGGGYHLVHATEEELEICSKKGVFAITNPSSNLKLSSGIAPVDRWLEKGISVAIGTDGPASNNALDFFREMFLVATLSKAVSKDPTVVKAEEVLKMACTNGAYAMGVPESDCIAVGKNADLIMIDLNQPNMQPVHNIVNNIVYAGSKNNVKMTMIAGKILYYDGEFLLHQKASQIYKNAEEACERIFA